MGELFEHTQRQHKKEAIEKKMKTCVAKGKKLQAVRCTKKGNVDDQNVFRRSFFWNT